MLENIFKSISFRTLMLVLVGGSFLLSKPTSTVLASDISLSITPPVFETMIKPGKTVTQLFTITNTGIENAMTVDMVPFFTNDKNGNVELQENLLAYDIASVKSWFSLVEPNIKLGGKFLLPRGGSQNVGLRISPPENAPEGDYYFTLLFETTDSGLVGQNSQAKVKIGTNILMTVSKTGQPTKSVEISEFGAPFLIDSFGNLSYNLTLKNTGSTFVKPIGTISIKPVFGEEIVLDLAPQNILAQSERVIPCLENEKLTSCNLAGKTFFGLYFATLKFKLDENGTEYVEHASTVAFPIVISFAVIVAVIILSTLKRILKLNNNNLA